MGILFAFIFISVSLIFLAGLVGGVIWLYRKFVKKDGSATPLFPTTPLVFPTHFNWALILLLLGFHFGLYTYFTYSGSTFRVPGAGLAIFTAFASSVWFFLLAKQRSFFLYCMIVVGMLSGFWLFWRANGFVQTWNIIFFSISQIILYLWFVKGNLPKSLGGWLGSTLALLPISFIQGLRVLASLIKREATQKASFFGWLKTAIIALIVLAVFLGLLSQADPVFAEIVKDFRSQLVGRALWSIVLVFLASLWWTISLKSDVEEGETTANWLSYRDVIAVLGVVVIVVGVFLAVQFKYLFGGSRELLTTLDLTFSEYVRKGFTELLTAVFIGGLLSYLAGVKTRLWDPVAQKTGQILNAIMVSELGLLLLSALKRDLLYVETYGLTRVRVVGGVFLIWLAFFLVVLFIYGWHKVKERVALAALWYGALLVLVSINVMNVDTIVAKGAPGHHEYTDYFYLMQLSEDASNTWPGTLSAIEQDTTALLSKSELTEEDRAQLAGLKLGLLSFIENRDSLFTKYAPADWLLQNHKRIGLDLPQKSFGYNDEYSWSQYRPIIETLFPSDTQLAQETNSGEITMPKSLQKYRAWEFSNYSEQRAYRQIENMGETAFTLPQSLLSDILKYQLNKQVSLENEERRLLEELKYQFITVRLNRYWPVGLQPLEIRELSDLPPYVREEFGALESANQPTLAALSALSCNSPEVQNGQIIPVYGVLRRQATAPTTATTSAALKTYELREFATTTYTGGTGPVLPITTAAQLKFVEPAKDQVYNTTPGGVIRQMDYNPSGYSANESYATFVKAQVKPTAVVNGTGCTVQFTSDEIAAYHGF